MEISVTRVAPQGYQLRIGEDEFAISEAELKALLAQASELLLPVAPPPSPERLAREFAKVLRKADGRAVQKLLRLADNADILVLLKAAEQERAITEVLYANMSERSRKIFAEDLAYKFKDGVPAADVGAALARLTRTVRQILEEGTSA